MAGSPRSLFYKLGVACLILLIGSAFFIFELYQYLTLERLKAYQVFLSGLFAENPIITIIVFMTIYIVVIAVSLPGSAIMTMAGGAIFGLYTGIVIVSFASSIGGTLAFLAARYLFRDYVQQRFKYWLITINHEITTHGAYYLLTLRLLPAIPFFLLNLVMALTPIKTSIFYITTQIGMLPVTVVYVNAGTQLASIHSLEDVFTFNIVASFIILALFPWIAKSLAAVLRIILTQKQR
jgi:uncharacterized membrane protein YdjX (TVP38/TMEM64 family)